MIACATQAVDAIIWDASSLAVAGKGIKGVSVLGLLADGVDDSVGGGDVGDGDSTDEGVDGGGLTPLYGVNV